MATAKNYYVGKKEILELKYKMEEYEEKDFDPFDPESDDGIPDSFWTGMREYQSHTREIVRELKKDWIDNYTSDGETLDPETGKESWETLTDKMPMLTNGSLVQALTKAEWAKLVKEINSFAWDKVQQMVIHRSKIEREEGKLGYVRFEEYTPEEFIKTYNPSLVDGKIFISKTRTSIEALRQYVDRHRNEIEKLLKKTKPKNPFGGVSLR